MFVDFPMQVMVQKQNRHMFMSVYLAVLAVDDTIVLASGRKLSLLTYSMSAHSGALKRFSGISAKTYHTDPNCCLCNHFLNKFIVFLNLVFNLYCNI